MNVAPYLWNSIKSFRSRKLYWATNELFETVSNCIFQIWNKIDIFSGFISSKIKWIKIKLVIKKSSHLSDYKPINSKPIWHMRQCLSKIRSRFKCSFYYIFIYIFRWKIGLNKKKSYCSKFRACSFQMNHSKCYEKRCYKLVTGNHHHNSYRQELMLKIIPNRCIWEKKCRCLQFFWFI